MRGVLTKRLMRLVRGTMRRLPQYGLFKITKHGVSQNTLYYEALGEGFSYSLVLLIFCVVFLLTMNIFGIALGLPDILYCFMHGLRA
ncbi:hypothetical protein VTL71DRAFT_7227 [Oculimacula yallundae]|uniref:Uncharacterized protein n=1 Tax=Oculimacula yallundae TaxID=86028 RepID=A0ABR4BXR8_9HELO